MEWVLLPAHYASVGHLVSLLLLLALCWFSGAEERCSSLLFCLPSPYLPLRNGCSFRSLSSLSILDEWRVLSMLRYNGPLFCYFKKWNYLKLFLSLGAFSSMQKTSNGLSGDCFPALPLGVRPTFTGNKWSPVYLGLAFLLIPLLLYIIII